MAQQDKTQDFNSLIELAHRRGSTDRKSLALQINDSFGAIETSLSDRERTLMHGILEQLLASMEQQVRRDLARTLSADPNVPAPLVTMLANDEIEIAAPILRNSRILNDPELVSIVRQRSKQHQLTICARDALTMTVSDALVETGNADVIAALLNNQHAEIRTATMAYLADQSKTVDAFREPLVRRADLPSHLAEKLYWLVSAALRSYIVDRFDVDPGHLDDGIERIVRDATTEMRAIEQNPTLSEALANELAQTDNFDPQFMVGALKSGEVPLFEAMLQQQTGLRGRLIRQLLFEADGDGLAIVCRGIGMPRDAFVEVLGLVSRVCNPNASSASAAPGRPVTLFDQLERSSAVALLRRWRRDPKYLEAQIEILHATRDATQNAAA